MKKFFIFITVFFLINSCGENKEAKVAKIIENCANKAFLDYYTPKYKSVNSAIKKLEEDITKNVQLIDFLIEEQNYFSSSEGQKEHAVDAHLITKTKKDNTIYYDYAQILGTNYGLLSDYKKQRLSEKARESLRNKTKESPLTKYMMVSYEKSLEGFETWIKYYKKKNLEREDKIEDYKTKEGRRKYNDNQIEQRKESLKIWQNYIKETLKIKLNDSVYNEKFIICEQLRKKSKIAFDERWK